MNSSTKKTSKVGRFGAMIACLLGVSSASAGTTDHLDMGLDLVEHLLQHQLAGEFVNGDNIELNRYGGSWGAGTLQVIPGDHDNGVMPYNLSKCGSFVTKLLNQSYNWSWSDYQFFDPALGQMVTTASPTAHRYMELILQQQGFQTQITDILDVMPGDVLVKRDVGTTTGHVWVIKEVMVGQPMAYPANSVNTIESLVGTTYFEVDVLDCSSGYHSNDTRKVVYDGQLYETHGAGVGTIGILVDQNGTIIGHTWSLPSDGYNHDLDSWVSQLNGKLKLVDETELVVGRLDLVDEIDEIQAPQPEEQIDPEPQNDTLAPLHLDLGRLLAFQILEEQAQDIYTDAEGVELNRHGGSWNSNSNPAMIRFADAEQGILPANNTKGTTLVTLLLAEAYDHSWWGYEFYDSKLDEVKKTSSPTSSRYVDLIEQNVGFSAQVNSLDQVIPGDVLAIRYLSSWSGHTMMVNTVDWDGAVAYPADSPDADPQWNGCWYVPVEVLDSTSNPHSNDSREVGDDELEGIGFGTIGVLVDANLEVVGHTWSLPSADPTTNTDQWVSQLHSRLKPQTERKVVVGRF